MSKPGSEDCMELAVYGGYCPRQAVRTVWSSLCTEVNVQARQ